MNNLNKYIIIKTLGCKLNFSESATIEQKFIEKGFVCGNNEELADAYIINTCAVTETAEKKCKQLIRHIKDVNPHCIIALIGCFSALKQCQSLKDDVDIILGNHNKLTIVEEIHKLLINNKINASLDVNLDTFFSSYSIHERTRSFLKIQDGCDYHCSYCTVCIARGKSRSDSVENIIKNAQDIINHGITEIILSGVNIGDFKTSKGEDFEYLLRTLEQLEGLQRIRISSIEPNLLTDNIIEMVQKSNIILPHFHIPLQSGNNRILKLMRRRYPKELFAEKVNKIRSSIPHACIAADVIVGFPSETDKDFEETYQFLESLSVNMLHVFPYSQRPNTPAATMDLQCSPNIKNKRTKALIELSNNKKKAFYQLNKGKIYPVLIEHKVENNYLYGFTPNYIKVKIANQPEYIGKIIKVELVDIDKDNIYTTKIIK